MDNIHELYLKMRKIKQPTIADDIEYITLHRVQRLIPIKQPDNWKEWRAQFMNVLYKGFRK